MVSCVCLLYGVGGWSQSGKDNPWEALPGHARLRGCHRDVKSLWGVG